MIAPSLSQTLRFRDALAVLYGAVPGRVELRVIRTGHGVVARAFFAPTDIDAIGTFCQTHTGDDLFFGVALRGEADRGTLDNCVALPALFVDIDFKDTPETDARQQLIECPLPASLTIASGGGLHAYWCLTEPVFLPADASLATGVLRRLATYLGGDLASAEPARVLRVPGGWNHKYDPARRVTIDQWEADRRYNVSDFDWLPSELAAPVRATEPASEVIRAGTRNARLYAIGRSLHARGTVPEAVLAALREINARQCVPPLGDLELAAIVAHVGQQGHRPDFNGPIDATAGPKANGTRHVTLTAASTIAVRPVKWLWQDRLALETLGLIGGREGIGKSIVTDWLAAQVTRGTLPGIHEGRPHAVIFAATEDSWEHTIVPRLMAHGADLTRVFRCEVTTTEGVAGTLTLPRDLPALADVIRTSETALTILDPLMSRLDASLDTHRDAEVRLALEPLSALAHVTQTTVLGLIHQNKTATTDPLTSLMASRAFVAVARAVLVAMVDPENEQARLLGQVKNNLGRVDLPTLQYQIVGVRVADTPEGEVWTGQLRWTGETDRTIRDATETAAASTGDRSATAEAADWLLDYLQAEGGSAASATIKQAARQAGHSLAALKRACHTLHVNADGRGYPRQTWWTLSSRSSLGETHRERVLTEPTVEKVRFLQSAQSTGLDPLRRPVGSVGPVGSVEIVPPRDEPTEPNFLTPAGNFDLTPPTDADLADPIGAREEDAWRTH